MIEISVMKELTKLPKPLETRPLTYSGQILQFFFLTTKLDMMVGSKHEFNDTKDVFL